MRILRTIAAVIGGYLVFALSAGFLFQLTGQKPHAHHGVPFMTLVAVYGMVFAAAAGVIAARVAPVRPTLHAALVAVLVATGAVVSLITSPAADATWSQWEAILLMAPCVMLGARLAGSRRNSV